MYKWFLAQIEIHGHPYFCLVVNQSSTPANKWDKINLKNMKNLQNINIMKSCEWWKYVATLALGLQPK
jgi:hypothetical protein